MHLSNSFPVPPCGRLLFLSLLCLLYQLLLPYTFYYEVWPQLPDKESLSICCQMWRLLNVGRLPGTCYNWELQWRSLSGSVIDYIHWLSLNLQVIYFRQWITDALNLNCWRSQSNGFWGKASISPPPLHYGSCHSHLLGLLLKILLVCILLSHARVH